jgi:hypothetical protein
LNIQDQYSRNCDKPPPRGGRGGGECETISHLPLKNADLDPLNTDPVSDSKNADPDPLYTDPDSDSKNLLSISPTDLVTITVNSLAFI